MSNATTFGRQAEAYAAGRPGYPDALLDWIAANSPGHARVWDVGCGSGQASRDLATRFAHVVATDLDAAQIAQAEPHPAITYRAAPAESSGLADASVDAVTAATSIHWFAGEPFWAEARRVARPGALLCAFSYRLPQVDGPAATTLAKLYDRLDPFWAEGNRIAKAGYPPERLGLPFPVVDAPRPDIVEPWTADRLLGFIRSWSAHFRAREEGLGELLGQLEDELSRNFGPGARPVTLPMSVLAARL